MKKFKFRLEKILQYRDSIKEEKLRDLKAATTRLKEAEEHLLYLETQFENNTPGDGVTIQVQDLYIQMAYSERLKQEIVAQKERIVEFEKAVEEARAIYIEASRDTEVLVKLKDKKLAMYEEFVAKQEEIFLDELVTQKRSATK